MIELDSEFATEEHRDVAIKLRKSTSLLVRHFHQNPDDLLKLQAMNDTRSTEYS